MIGDTELVPNLPCLDRGKASRDARQRDTGQVSRNNRDCRREHGEQREAPQLPPVQVVGRRPHASERIPGSSRPKTGNVQLHDWYPIRAGDRPPPGERSLHGPATSPHGGESYDHSPHRHKRPKGEGSRVINLSPQGMTSHYRLDLVCGLPLLAVCDLAATPRSAQPATTGDPLQRPGPRRSNGGTASIGSSAGNRSAMQEPPEGSGSPASTRPRPRRKSRHRPEIRTGRRRATVSTRVPCV
jgi:hypothetical protein